MTHRARVTAVTCVLAASAALGACQVGTPPGATTPATVTVTAPADSQSTASTAPTVTTVTTVTESAVETHYTATETVTSWALRDGAGEPRPEADATEYGPFTSESVCRADAAAMRDGMPDEDRAQVRECRLRDGLYYFTRVAPPAESEPRPTGQ